MFVVSCISESGLKSLRMRIKGEVETPICEMGKQVKIVKSFMVFPTLIAASSLIASSPILQTPPECIAQTADIERGASLFGQACIGCHDAGGNLIQPGATLFSTDLQRNGADTEEEIYRITYYGKGRMPGFGEKCKPRGQCTFGPRLQEEEIKLLAKFVKLQADRGWPNSLDHQ